MHLYKNKHQLPSKVQSVFEEMLETSHVAVDRVFAKILLAQWIFAIACAWLISPFSWSGSSSEVHIHLWSAIFLGGMIVTVPQVLIGIAPGKLVTRLAVSAAQLMYSSLLIHLLGGRIEAHFHVFVSLALLAAYRDRMVFVPAVAITIIDHLVRGYLWPQSVFGMLYVPSWRPFEHIAWILFETATLCYLIQQNLKHIDTVASLQCVLQEQRDELERKVSERTQDLLDAKAFQEVILNSIDAEVCILDESGTIVFVNDRWRKFGVDHGVSKVANGVGKNYLDACDRSQGPESIYAQTVAKSIRDVRDGKSTGVTNEYPCHHGESKKWFHVRINPIQLGEIRGVSLVHIDVTATKTAQLRAESLAELVLNSPDEVYILSKDTLRFVEVNHGSCANLGYDRATLLTMTPLDLQPTLTRESLDEMLDDLVTGKAKTVSFESAHQRKDGSSYQCSLNLHTSVLEDQEVIVAFVTDTTERKQLEDQLAQAQKLESVGQLAAGVAHEINTPMQCVFGNVEFLNTSFAKLLAISDHVVTLLEKSDLDWSEEREVIEELRQEYHYEHLRQQTPIAIQEAADASTKVISIIRAMKVMSHQGSVKKLPIDLHDMIRSAATITRSRWKLVAETELEFDANLHAISVQPAEMSQVFFNLLANAADALSEKLGEEPRELGKIKIKTKLEDDWVKITFSDTGAGIPASVRKRIFDPFFTTKQVGKGTGQGLSICRNVIVNRHSGTIDVESVEGLGTTFIIRLPRFPSSDEEIDRRNTIPTSAFRNSGMTGTLAQAIP